MRSRPSAGRPSKASGQTHTRRTHRQGSDPLTRTERTERTTGRSLSEQVQPKQHDRTTIKPPCPPSHQSQREQEGRKLVPGSSAWRRRSCEVGALEHPRPHERLPHACRGTSEIQLSSLAARRLGSGVDVVRVLLGGEAETGTAHPGGGVLSSLALSTAAADADLVFFLRQQVPQGRNSRRRPTGHAFLGRARTSRPRRRQHRRRKITDHNLRNSSNRQGTRQRSGSTRNKGP